MARLGRFTASILLVLLAACGRGAPPPPPEAAPPDVHPGPYVFVLVIDGLRPDILRQEAPNIDRLAEAGAVCWRGRASVPSQTRVNFVTIPTGAHADRHGIVGGAYRDDSWVLHRTDRPDPVAAQRGVLVPTVFEALEAAGIPTAYLGMKGYEIVGGRGASIAEAGRDLIPDEIYENRYEIEGNEDRWVDDRIAMNRHVLDRLREVVEKNGVRFAIANLGATDYVAHKLGPETPHYRRAVRATDAQVGEFVRFLDERGIRDSTTIVITADHGFTQILHPENVLLKGGGEEGGAIPEIAAAKIEHDAISRGGLSFSLYVRDPRRVRDAYRILRGLPWVAKIYTEHDLPGRDGTLSDLRYHLPGRTGDFFVDVHPTHTLNFDNRGQHGSTSDTDMTIAIILSGRGVRPGAVLDAAGNIDIAPTVLALFGLDPAAHLEADGRVLGEALE